MDSVTWERGYQRAYRKAKIQYARLLRVQMTSAERYLWELVRAKKFHGLKFRRQEPIGPYIADFCCHQMKLIVEVDGSIHQRQKERDADRDLYFNAWGYQVLRIANEDILKCDGKIALQKIHAATGKSVPLSCKERG